MNHPTPQEAAREKIEYIATKVMGWEIKRSPTSKKYDRYIKGYWHLNNGKTRPHYSYMRYWNPLEDWNNWRQVEEKVMEMNNGLWREFIVRIPKEADYWLDACKQLMKADLPTR